MIALLLAAAAAAAPVPTSRALKMLDAAFVSSPLSLAGVTATSTQAQVEALGARPPAISHDVDGDDLLVLGSGPREAHSSVWVTLEAGRVVHASLLLIDMDDTSLFSDVRAAIVRDLGEPAPATFDPAAVHALMPFYGDTTQTYDGVRWVRADGVLDLLRVGPNMVFLALSPGGEDALQQEVCEDLGHLWVAETAFHGEYGTWTTDLVSVNWAPRNLPHAVYGFCTASHEPIAGITDFQPSRDTTADPALHEHLRFSASGTDFATPCDTLRSLGIRDAFTASGAGWRAFAIGRVGPGDDGLRVWTIGDDRKVSRLR